MVNKRIREKKKEKLDVYVIFPSEKDLELQMAHLDQLSTIAPNIPYFKWGGMTQQRSSLTCLS